MTKYEALIPLEDLYEVPNRFVGGVSFMPGASESPEVLKRIYGVNVHHDHRNRPGVTVADAYKIRDARIAAAEKLAAEHMAESLAVERLAAWQRARNEFWSKNRTRVGREIGPGIDARRHLPLIAASLSEQVVAAEKAAGIPADIAKRLTWPSVTSWTDPDRGEDTSYKAPEEQYR